MRRDCKGTSLRILMLSAFSNVAAMKAPTMKATTEAVCDVELWEKRSSQASEFARLLGTGSEGASGGLSNLLSGSLKDHDVALTLPSLDLGISRDEKNSPLPVIGEHRESLTASPVDDSRPTMAASVLTSATEGAANSEQNAAQNIGKLTSWTKSTLEYASDAVKKNLANSFASLVDSRVRAWTLLLLRHSLSTGDGESRSRLLSMLSSSIKIDYADTNFKTLPLPESAAEQAQEQVILPLLFEVTLHATVQDSKESVTLRAPGTIMGECDS